MTARERIMIYALGGLALGGIGYLAFTTLVRPIREQNARIETLKDQIADRDLQLDRDRFDNLRLQKLVPLSLPGNRELAESEYETMLGRLLRDSAISGGKYSRQSQSDSDPEPELVASVIGKPGKKAYTKIIYSITFEKVTLSKLTGFLERYAQVPILHQIVKCSIKHATTAATAGKTQKAEERNDLTVNLVSEAVLLDGAPERKTLFAVPDTFGAALGGVALFTLRNDTEKSRYLTPTPDAAYHATTAPKRDYELLAARDPFHGPLPEYPPIGSKPKVVAKDDGPPPPFDSSPYVYLSSLVRTEVGGKLTAADADINDRIYNQVYTVKFTQLGDLSEMKIQRFTKELKTDPKTKEVSTEVKLDRSHPRAGGLMELSDRTAKAIRTFKVYGLNGNALILGEKEKKPDPPKDDKAKAGGGRPVKGAKPPAAALPKPDPVMGAVGGFGAVKSVAEKFYWWEVGQPLSQIRLLSEMEAKLAVAHAAKGLGVAAPPPPPPATALPAAAPPTPPLAFEIEEAPPPRLHLN